jgi:hypothetical protein
MRLVIGEDNQVDITLEKGWSNVAINLKPHDNSQDKITVKVNGKITSQMFVKKEVNRKIGFKND